jgi:hypothetical protein
MADSLYFKADRSITKHTGTELSLITPKGGGHTHRFPQWWDRKNTIQYVRCAIFKVALPDNNAVRLVVPIEKEGVSLDIRHDGEGNFSFPAHQCIERVAVVDLVDTTLLHEYQFPSISSGRVMKRIIADLPSTPTASIGTVLIAGDAAANETDEKTYTASISGDATSLTYSWSKGSGNTGSFKGSSTAASATFTFGNSTTTTLTCTVNATDEGITDSPQSGTISVTVTPTPEEESE